MGTGMLGLGEGRGVRIWGVETGFYVKNSRIGR